MTARGQSRSPSSTADPIRVPPHSIDAEQAVLGALMLDESAWERVADKVSEDDFYREEHRVIYRAIGDLAGKNQPCDAVTLGEWFEANGQAERVGGVTYVIQLANATPSAVNIVAYAAIVREKSILRQLIDCSTKIMGNAFNAEGRTPEELLAIAEQSIFRIAESGARGKATNVEMRQVMKEAFRIVHERFQSDGALTGLGTSFIDIDEMTGGLQPADLIVIAARPSMGKSALATNIAEHVAIKLRKPVAIFSMEMSSTQLGFRMLASIGRIDQKTIRTGKLDDVDWPRYTAASGILAEAKILIDDTSALSPVELRARARRLKRQHDIGLIVVDYLQLMSVPGTRENRATEIAEISRSMKALAKELNIPVIALSQLNRSVEQRMDKRPVMADLRESGAIEQDADVIVFIYRDDYYNKESTDKGTAEIIVSKQRNGPTGTVKLTFIGKHSKFENYSPGNRGEI